MQIIDYHTHSTNSPDGTNTVEELVLSAIDKKVKEIAITDHYEPPFFATSNVDKYVYREALAQNPGYGKMDTDSYSYDRNKFFAEINAVREKYGDKIRIKAGVELGNPESHDIFHSNFLTEDYDFVIGSIHRIDNDFEIDDGHYTAQNYNEVFERYFYYSMEMAKWGKFNVCGHCMYPVRFVIYRDKVPNVDLCVYYPYLREMFKLLMEKGIGIEINTAGIKKGFFLPDINILRLYKKLGGEILTIGSDAHMAKDIGRGFYEALDMVRDAGFKYLTVFDRQKPEFVRID